MSIVLDPPSDTGTADRPGWHPVCLLDDLEPEWGEAALLAGQQVALFRLWDGSVRAVSNRDPVSGSFVLARGIVGSKADRPTIASPLHKQVYDLVSGQCLSHPELVVATYPVRITDGVVQVRLPPAAG